jgi:hypothetical protein
MSAGDVSVEIKGSEKDMQHGHQLNLGDRDPTNMNDHVRVSHLISQVSITYPEPQAFDT